MEVIVANNDDAEEGIANATVEETETDSDVEDDNDDVADDMVMQNVNVVEVVSTRHLPSCKAFPAPSSF